MENQNESLCLLGRKRMSKRPACLRLRQTAENTEVNLSNLLAQKKYLQAVEFMKQYPSVELYEKLLYELLSTLDDNCMGSLNTTRMMAVITLLDIFPLPCWTYRDQILGTLDILGMFLDLGKEKEKMKSSLDRRTSDRNLMLQRLFTALEQHKVNDISIHLDEMIFSYVYLDMSSEFVEKLQELLVARRYHELVSPLKTLYPFSRDQGRNLFSKAVTLRLLDEAILLYETGAVSHKELDDAAQSTKVQEVLYGEQANQTDKDADQTEYLRSVLKNPRSLVSSALLKVSTLLGPKPGKKVQSLKLPSFIVEHVLFKRQAEQYFDKKKEKTGE